MKFDGTTTYNTQYGTNEDKDKTVNEKKDERLRTKDYG